MYGIPAITTRKLPDQNHDVVLLVADRFQRAAQAHRDWAEPAKLCVDFVEGRQWTTDQLAKLEAKNKPALVFNKIAPLVRLVAGYHRNARTDIKFLPGDDGRSSDDVAEILTALAKNIAEVNLLDYVDTEVFLDGMMTGRGFWDLRMDFTKNDFGEVKVEAVDPFSVYIDPEAGDYDLDKASYMLRTRWISIEEARLVFGPTVADLLQPFLTGTFQWNSFPDTLATGPDQEITPVRHFGMESERSDTEFTGFRDTFNNHLIDHARKAIRVIDMQHYRWESRRVFIDLETGDRSEIPVEWDEQRIAKALYHAERLGNPLRVETRMLRICYWTITVGDLIVYNRRSPYDTFTYRAFFPYFRRGITRGMVNDLIDPQIELNKSRSLTIEIIGRTSNGGWKYEEGALNPTEEANLKKYGSTPGFNLKVQQGMMDRVQRMDPAPFPEAMAKREQFAEEDLRKISGINEATLGIDDRVQSGRALEARQRQAVMAIQTYMDNFSRSKHGCAHKVLELVQNFYTEQRVFRVLGEDGRMVQKIINQSVIDPMKPTAIDKLNDVTLGKYVVSIDETPMAATFANAQFEEMLVLFEKLQPFLGPALPAMAGQLIDASTMPRKDEIKEILAQMGMAVPDPLMTSTALAGGGVPMPGGGVPGAMPAPAGPMPPPGAGAGQVVPMPQRM